MAEGKGRSKGFSVLPEQRRHSSTLDITSHTHDGVATRFHAKNVSVSTDRTLEFTDHIAFAHLRVYSMLLRLHTRRVSISA